MKLLGDNPAWKRLIKSTSPDSDKIAVAANPSGETMPTTPVPVPNAAWQQLQMEMSAQSNNTFCYKVPNGLQGISACHAALDRCMRIHQIISPRIWIPSSYTQEIMGDMHRRFKCDFRGIIPFSHGILSTTGQHILCEQWIIVTMDANIFGNQIMCILP